MADSNSTPETSAENFRKFFKWEKVKSVVDVKETEKPTVMTIIPTTTSDTSTTKKTKKQWKSTTMEEGIVPPIPKELIYGFELKQQNVEKKNKLTKMAFNNPLVPIGMASTVACLIGMFVATMKRDRMKAQYYMRGRIAAQFFTFCVLVGGALYMGRTIGNTPGQIPKTNPETKSLKQTILEYFKN